MWSILLQTLKDLSVCSRPAALSSSFHQIKIPDGGVELGLQKQTAAMSWAGTLTDGGKLRQTLCTDSDVLEHVHVTCTLPYDIKIVIAGNHELTFDQEFMADLIKQDFYYFPSASKLKPENYENVQSLLTNCIYLQDSEVTVRGFRIYGSPWRVQKMLVGEAESLGPGEEKPPGLAGLIWNLEVDPSHRRALVSDSARGSSGPSCQVTCETSLFAARGLSTWLNSGGQRRNSAAS
ncbi:Metallophosphoesterase domain-containing protein 1 [Takifugu flavidus]|uniref:Metallophosphoesterase domain-containing protein 1 n=1 Tax=Takifugu flavidus TaxID=433684 RepID=A0A5C6ND01_9TELE|nr:Metallophosphoesterase domain-containing protein 1 [Takifugu flavidus]